MGNRNNTPRLMFIGFAASMSVLLILFITATLMGY